MKRFMILTAADAGLGVSGAAMTSDSAEAGRRHTYYMSATGTSLADASKKLLLKFNAADRYAKETGGRGCNSMTGSNARGGGTSWKIGFYVNCNHGH